MKLKIITVISIGIFLISCKEDTEPMEKLWYKDPAQNWFEALPLGNGRLGAMIFGGVGKEHIQLNEESLWAGCPEDPYPENVREHYTKFRQLNLQKKYDEALDYALEYLAIRPTSFRSYTTFGDLFLEVDHINPQNYRRYLDLENGIHTVEYEIDGKRFKRESFISTEYDALFYHFSSIDDQPMNCDISYERKADVKQYVDEDDIMHINGQIYDDPDGYDDNRGGSGEGGYHMKFSGQVAVKLENGEIVAEDSLLSVHNSSEFTVIFTAATDYNPELMDFDRSIDSRDISASILARALKTPYERIKNEHRKIHAAIYNRVDFKIAQLDTDTIPTDERIKNVKNGVPDPYLTQLFFQYGRYLLLASSGGNAKLPANLQGIWNEEIWARWESDYHLNINLQMNYWPADVCNISETFVPLSDYMVRLAQKGREPARKYIGSEGWIAHHTSNAFGRVTPSGSTKESQVNNGYCFPLGGAWMAISLWRHYEFNQDRQYLAQKVYPVIHGATRFILDYLVENENGDMVTVPSYSPENSYYDPVSGKELRNTMGATIDIQIIRNLFQACMQSESILSENNLSDEINAALEKLPEVKIGADGTIQEWYEDYEDAEPGHRHISHLFGLYPADQITKTATPELYEAAKRTVEKRLSYGGGQTGWSRAWIINFYARLLLGNECNKHIEALIDEHIAPNLFDLHPPYTFQIDGNLGATAGIAEMLIQSHEESTIRLLPALPDAWSDGHVTGLKARGGYEVDLFWENGDLVKSNIRSKRKGKVTVIYNEKSIDLDLEKNETYVLEEI